MSSVVEESVTADKSERAIRRDQLRKYLSVEQEMTAELTAIRAENILLRQRLADLITRANQLSHLIDMMSRHREALERTAPDEIVKNIARLRKAIHEATFDANSCNRLVSLKEKRERMEYDHFTSGDQTALAESHRADQEFDRYSELQRSLQDELEAALKEAYAAP